MEKYRKKEEVFVWQWTGDKSIISEIGEKLVKYNGQLGIGVASSDPNILYLKQEMGNQIGQSWANEFVRLSNYIVLDDNNYETPLRSYDEEWFNKNFIKI